MDNQFFSMLSRMKLINRWGLMRNTMNENISEHSINVAIIAHALAVIRNTYFDGKINAERAALLGIYHDAAEIITGDLPTPVKYFNPELRTAYKQVEEQAAAKLLSMLPRGLQETYASLLTPSEEDYEIWTLVKAADKISALIKCVEERVTGNRDFIKAERAALKAVKDMCIMEADYFLEAFMPSFDKTIDEQT